MSWIEKINNDITIRTGDGKTYNPKYVIAPISREYNVAEFNFPNIFGTLVNKSEPMGRKFTLDITFDGTDHLDVARNFETSLNDRRENTVIHPMYGTIVCHASSITQNAAGINTSTFSIQYAETITTTTPRTSIDPVRGTTNKVESFNEDQSQQFSTVALKTTDVTILSNTVEQSYTVASASIKSGDESNKFFNLFNESKVAIGNALTDAKTAIQKSKMVIQYPAYFSESVKFRLNLFIIQLNSLHDLIGSVISPNEKLIFETNTTTLIGGMIQTVVTPFDSIDYENTVDVLTVIELLNDSMNVVVNDLDALQTPNGGDVDSYIPNFDSLSGLQDAFNLAISNLMEIAMDGKQERIFINDYDSNIFLLAHRFYGLKFDDSTIDTLIKNNSIGLNELLLIKKNRKIKYYL
jgi:hypothetical protein